MVRGRLAVALLTGVAIILSAPYVGRLRHYVLAAFPGRFGLILGLAVGGSIAIALVVAALRIRSRHAFRYGCIGAALAIGAGYSLLISSPEPQVAAVERFHFVEYGLLTFLFYRAWQPLGDPGTLLLPAVAAITTGTIEEWFQWFVPGRVGTVDDVFLNGVAIACGLLFSLGADPPGHVARRLGPRSLAHLEVAATLSVLVFGMFFDSVHVGHRITDPTLGSFVSLHTAEELAAASRDRAARWAANPPIDRTRLAREDQYRTEGIQHVQERNRAWDRRDFDAAWRQNAILERYYAPVLDTGHRWPDEQRRDAEQRRTGMPAAGDYKSAAYPYTVYAWPRTVFWVGIALLMLAVLWLTRGRRVQR